MEYDHEQHSPSFRLKLKSSICASSCFTYHSETEAASSSTCSDDEIFHRPALASRPSPSSWIRSKAHDLPEEIKEKCASFFSKIGGKASRRPNNTSEFRYDPMSYALNFDDEASRIDEFPLRNFSARLPPSPPPKTRSEKRFPAAVSRQIAACSEAKVECSGAWLSEVLHRADISW